MKTSRLFQYIILSVISLFFSGYAIAQFPTFDYDIYTYNVKTGQVDQLTSISGAGEFNPAWSPDGLYVLHDVVTPATHDLYITEFATGVSTQVVTNGNDGVWSPNGYTIAYDWMSTVHILDLITGTTSSISDAIDPEYSNKSWQLAFHRPSDGMIYTLNLISGDETSVAMGLYPTWSKNGKYIAFTNGGDIYKQRMHPSGSPIGSPVALTSNPDDEGEPTWSQNGKTVAFSSGNAGTESYDIHTVSASGGTPNYLVGNTLEGEFDPDYSHNGRFIAYAGYTDPIAPIIALPQAEKKDNDLVIYPNPADDFLELSILPYYNEEITFKLFDFSGRKVIEENVDAQKILIDIGALQSGIYYFSVSSDNVFESGQVIVH